MKEGAAGRTVNIETNLLRLVLRKAKLWSNLVDDVQSLKENTDTGRELSDDEASIGKCEVSISRALCSAVLTSIHNGLRRTELRLLRWRQVDLLNGTIPVDNSAASRIAAGGATDQTLQSPLGWMNPKMVEKYSHVQEEAKWRAVAVFDVAVLKQPPPKLPYKSTTRENQNVI